MISAKEARKCYAAAKEADHIKYLEEIDKCLPKIDRMIRESAADLREVHFEVPFKKKEVSQALALHLEMAYKYNVEIRYSEADARLGTSTCYFIIISW
jgi:hypothetical protein